MRKSFPEALKKAIEGDAEAQFLTGSFYNYGDGIITEDKAKALKWWLKAAEQGYAKAQVGLGELYYRGDGVPQDYAEAVKWYGKSAEQGDAMAQHSLGAMYGNGDGVPQDYAKAYMFFNLASVSHDEARKSRDKVIKRMTKEQIAEGQKLTREWIARKAKEKGQ